MDNMPVDVYHRKKNMESTIGGSGGGGKLAGAVRLINRRRSRQQVAVDRETTVQ
jgi:hypothetical protein